MASVFNALGVGRIGQILSRAFAMDDANPTPALGAEMVPGVVLESERPEWGFLSDELRYAGAGALSGVALANSAWCLRNPSGSGQLCVVERVVVCTDYATSLIFQGLELVDTDLAAVVPHAAIDTRAWPVGGVRRSSMVLSAGTAFVATGNSIAVNYSVATTPVLMEPCIVAPGSRMWVYVSNPPAGGVYMTCAIRWRARAATSTELQR